MKSKVKYLLCVCLLFACTNHKKRESRPSDLYQEAKTVKLNNEGGYFFNQLTGDTIETILNSLGDTVQTGVPIPAKGKTVYIDSLVAPQVIKKPSSDKFVVNNAHPNVRSIAENLTVFTIQKDSLTQIMVPEIDASNYIVSPIGDTLPTGSPIATKGKKLEVKQPQLTKAFLPARKDEATSDLQYLDVDQGMNSSYIYSMLEDRKGNLWFGSNGGGVSRYDGTNFMHYTVEEGLNNNYVVSMLEDQNGDLWFGTNGGGVCKYDGKSFFHFLHSSGLPSHYIFSIIEDQNGDIWFGSYGGGVSKYDGDSFTHYTVKEGLSSNAVRSLMEDKQGNIWIGTWGAGLNKFDGSSFTQFKQEDGLSSNYILSAIEDRDGNLWFGTWGGGAVKYNGTSFTHYNDKIGLGSDIVMAMLEDQSGNIWFCTNDRGMTKFDGQYFTYFTEKEGLTNNYVASILEDQSGNLWFGTNGGGVNLFNGNSFTHFTDRVGLTRNTIFSILEDQNENLWFGAYGGGVNKYEDSTFTHFTAKQGLSHNTIMSSLEDQNGNLWFGTNGKGVCKYDGESFIQYQEDQGFSGKTIYSILEDKKGNIWFGTDRKGVTKYDGKSFTHYTDKESLTNNSIRAIFEDHEGNIWMSTYGGGVSKYDGDTFTHYTEKEGLSDNIVLSIEEDSDRNLWFGTYGGGVNKFDGKSFTYYSEKEGLSSNIIWSIKEDENNNLWMSTEEGINLMKLENSRGKDSTHAPQIFVFGKYDGLKDLKFHVNSACLDSKNNLWWGSGKSLTRLDLDEFSITEKPPKVYLRQLNIQGRFIDYRNMKDTLENKVLFSSVRQSENYPLNLELPYDNNHLTFYFSAIDWYAPHKIKYSYLLEGQNVEWSIPNQEAKADYRNLSHGTYTFKVRAIGESGEWSEAFEYTFTIHPPWWLTLWAKIAYGLTGIALIFGLIRWRTNKLKQRQKELEAEVEIATKEILEQKNEAEKQKEIVEEKNKEIMDSIQYAKRLQDAILPPKKQVKEYFKNSFILFRPKDVVSGDFYWMETRDDLIFFAAADCTGHGVPGAMVSVVCANALNKSVNELGKTNPADILNTTRSLVIETFSKSGNEVKDGMDISLCVFKRGSEKLLWAGANNPLWIIRGTQNEVEVIKADKQPIGIYYGEEKPFTAHSITMNRGDFLYMFSDGFADQFGGERGKKMKSGKFKQLLLKHHEENMEQQRIALEKAFDNWKGDLSQIDDVCVIGVKIS
jgi:ligand-binding sensor domain-containing protein/serine phosphatase RsbU (regulator of sigma subunit)